MDAVNTLLISGGTNSQRKLLRTFLCEKYVIAEVNNTHQIVNTIDEREDVSVVLVGISTRRKEDLEMVEELVSTKKFKSIPLIVFAMDEYEDMEVEYLRIGVWDYIRKPDEKDVVRVRVNNAMDRRKYYLIMAALTQEGMDSLTGIFKKDEFIKQTRKLIDKYKDNKFAIIHFDIYKFHMFNTAYGKEEGDKLIKYLAGICKGISKIYTPMTYCHEDADVFYMCMPFVSEAKTEEFFRYVRKEINKFRNDYEFLPDFGVYIIEDRKLDVQDMMGYAGFAAKNCKGSYIKNFAYYSKEMSDNVLKEQFILNNMNQAIKEEQFIIFLQPKYELTTNMIKGAEALVRWENPEKGMISPGDFIPIFEKNGFIMALDFYVWEHTCQIIAKWIKDGHEAYPVSVNVSRVSLYNPNVADVIGSLVDKYEIPANLLQLELTESAYTDNPVMIKETMLKLHSMGFTILMDDFGSGYSSLNVLKDIAVDILKIDMKFMAKGDVPGRSENILAAVVRMAKWLNMPVVAEGVETVEQAKFLKSIGCEYVQGYYFAKPMPVENYEARAFCEQIFIETDNKSEKVDNSIWVSNEQIETLFSNISVPVAIFEYDGYDDLEAIKVNEAYSNIFGFDSLRRIRFEDMDSMVVSGATKAFSEVIKNHGESEFEFSINNKTEYIKWYKVKLKYLTTVGTRHIIFATFIDITDTKEIDSELQKYKRVVEQDDSIKKKILLVDDLELNRSVLKEIFEPHYDVFEVDNGNKALEKIKKMNYDIDLIVLDLNMPVMDGNTFLRYRAANKKIKKIPVVIISCNDSTQVQVDILSKGEVSDYIVKPFVHEAVLQRVKNVLNSKKALKDLIEK